jgi:predicted NAD/FAD-dependent oxidoreductase
LDLGACCCSERKAEGVEDRFVTNNLATLTLDDHGMAWLAADRSMRAAAISEDPLIIGSAARIITHALTAGRHYQAATTTAARSAEQLAAELRQPTPQSLSVYGSLLLCHRCRARRRPRRQHDPA